MKRILLYITIVVAFASCKGGIGGSSMTGEPGDMLVVINDELGADVLKLQQSARQLADLIEVKEANKQ